MVKYINVSQVSYILYRYKTFYTGRHHLDTHPGQIFNGVKE